MNMSIFKVVKAKVATQKTKTLIDGLHYLETKLTLDTYERTVRVAICDVIEDRKGIEFIDNLLDQLELAAAA